MTTSAGANMPKRTKWLLTIAVVMVLYTVIGFFVVPAIVKAQMLKRLPALTKRQVAIKRVRFNPYVLSLTIDGFSLKETNGDVFSSFGELYVNFQLSSIFKGAWVFDEISLQDPFAQIIYLKDGTFNFANLINNPPPVPPPAPKKPQPPLPVIVYHLRITNAAVAFSDLTRQETFNIRYQPININLTDFTTLRDKSSPYRIVATGDSGEHFGWSGDITVNPLSSSGTFQLGGLKLNKYQPYSHDYALFEIVDGQLDVAADYRYDSSTNALDLEISNAVVTLTRFQLKTPDTGEEVLSIPTLSIGLAEASVARRTARVGQIKSSGGSILIRQNHDGTLNLLSNLVQKPKTAAVAVSTNSSPPAGPPWTVKVDEIAFDNYAIKAEDKVPPKPAAFSIDQLAFNLKNVSNVSNTPVALALSLRLQETGLIGVNGMATLLPPSADLLIGVTNLDLRMVQPYVEQQVKMAIAHGALNVNGRAHYLPAGKDAPLADFAGDVSLLNFAVTDEVLFNDMAKWDALEVTGIQAEVQPFKLKVGRIKVSGPSTSVIILPDHRFNFLTILPEKKPRPAETAQTSAPPPTNTIPNLTFGEFAFENASLHFADRSIEPNCTFDIQQSSGSIKDISSSVQTPSALEVKGNVDQFSPFSITGTLNPMPDKLFVNISIAFTNTGLTSLSPYTEKYVGRPLQKGKLSLALHYDINQKALNATNDVFIDQLTLGAKNGSTNATKLPVKLAIALLKDQHGRIKLDVPVHGRIDDPKFKIWPIIEGVIENLIVKAATAPFSLLGSMFGGGPELSFVAFAPGHADIPQTETNKLNILAKALYERPELTLEINGSVDPTNDRPVMVRAKFQRQIKALFIKEMVQAGKPVIAVDELKLEPGDYERLVVQMYTNTFGPYHPPGTNQVTGTNAPSSSQKPNPSVHFVAKYPPPPPRSWFESGASRMAFSLHGGETVPAPQTASQTAPVANPTATPSAPVTVAQSDLADMEEQLLQKVEISNDDLRQLMQNRASQVQASLLQSGKVTPERLFITAPKPIQPNFKGEDRVNLTLD
jgi:hypothetical protein